jgi:hypothetical protein
VALCLEAGRGFAVIGKSSKKLLVWRREDEEAFCVRAAAAPPCIELGGGPGAGGWPVDALLKGGAATGAEARCCMLGLLRGFTTLVTRSVGRSKGEA